MSAAATTVQRGAWILAAVVAVLAIVLALAWGFQRRLIYLPSNGPVPPAASVLTGAEDVVLHTDDGLVLHAWWAPPTGADRGRAVLLTPGNAGSRADRAALAERLAASGLGVLLVDYRGYGGNPGDPSEEGLAADARAAHRHLVEDRRIDPGRILLLGESLGAAVATRLAVERPVGGLVLRSPFTDMAAVAQRHYPFLPARALLRDRFDVLARVAAVPVPVVVVAGGADEVVPSEQSRAVADAGGARWIEVPGARHNDAALGSGDAVVEAVVSLADAG